MSEVCELCGSGEDARAVEVAPRQGAEAEVVLCATCRAGSAAPGAVPAAHWYCLREAMWNERTAVKVLVYRTLRAMSAQPLAQELLGQIYLDDEAQGWADDGADDAGEDVVVRDSNRTVLQDGDTVTLIKDLEVKGAGFTAKRGTAVKGIALTGDPRYVEGKVNGMTIVLVAEYLKKS